MDLNPEATFDCLVVADRLQAQHGSFSAPEVHLFSYLACLLSLYRRQVLADWGHDFVGTELGAPFSRHIDSAVQGLLERGFLIKFRERLLISEAARARLRTFEHLNVNMERLICLEAACASAAALSVGIVSSALAHEPELSRAQSLPSSRQLLEGDAAQKQLYAQFEMLRQGLNRQSEDVRLPAFVWLTALYQANEGVSAIHEKLTL